jgi:hypothetical protein
MLCALVYRIGKISFQIGVDSAGGLEGALEIAKLETLNTVGFEMKASRWALIWYIIGRTRCIKSAYV